MKKCRLSNSKLSLSCCLLNSYFTSTCECICYQCVSMMMREGQEHWWFELFFIYRHEYSNFYVKFKSFVEKCEKKHKNSYFLLKFSIIWRSGINSRVEEPTFALKSSSDRVTLLQYNLSIFKRQFQLIFRPQTSQKNEDRNLWIIFRSLSRCRVISRWWVEFFIKIFKKSKNLNFFRPKVPRKWAIFRVRVKQSWALYMRDLHEIRL